jgi:hypothetical protein
MIRTTELIFATAVGAAYVALAAGLFGFLDARSVSLIALIGAGVASFAVLAFVFFSDFGYSRFRRGSLLRLGQ